MVDSVAERRKIPREEALAISSKLFHPTEALKAKLIDSISTFEEFAAVNYPNHAVEDVVYRLDGTRLRPTLTQQELSAISALFEVMEMPSVAMLSSEDLLLSALRDVVELLQARLNSDASLDELELFLEAAFARLSHGVEQSGLVL